MSLSTLGLVFVQCRHHSFTSFRGARFPQLVSLSEQLSRKVAMWIWGSEVLTAMTVSVDGKETPSSIDTAHSIDVIRAVNVRIVIVTSAFTCCALEMQPK